MTESNSTPPVQILLVEDNPGDVRLTEEALKEFRFSNKLNVVQDGVEALSFLRREGKYRDAPVPDLILLDLNLPKKDGREVLAEIKTDPLLKEIPVVVLTISNSEQDIMQTYELHANDYITKPIDLEQFTWAMKLLGDFWFRHVKVRKEANG